MTAPIAPSPPQPHPPQGMPHRKKLLTLRGGYHGDTFGAMAICDPSNGMHAQLFSGALIEHFFAPLPPRDHSRSLKRRTGSDASGAAAREETCVSETRALLETHGSSIAALIVEPLVQGAGMSCAPPPPPPLAQFRAAPPRTPLPSPPHPTHTPVPCALWSRRDAVLLP